MLMLSLRGFREGFDFYVTPQRSPVLLPLRSTGRGPSRDHLLDWVTRKLVATVKDLWIKLYV